jgi:solute carrier family 26 (sodium-independent sulfate anion transporter), member 11
MSPWIRRALIAGGFGFSSTRRDVRVDVVSVVPYRGGTSTHSSSPLMDAEAVSYKGEEGGEEWGTVAVLDRRTPFFHVDLVAAVRAAES